MYQRLQVSIEGEVAHVRGTLDFTGVFRRDIVVSSLGFEDIRFIRRSGDWEPETSLAPRLVKAIRLLRARLGLSYLPQEASIFRKLNVEDNVRAVLELQFDEHGKPLTKAEIELRLTALLQDLRVDHLRESSALALSGGERRRVEIARALATQPQFILLDEPFAGIDPIAVIEIQRIISFLKSRGIGVLITDHNVRETLGICDHAFIISDGSVLAQGTPAAIINNERHSPRLS